MNKQRKIIFLIVFLLAIISVGVFFLQKRQPQNVINNNIADPFVGIVIPEEFDEATRAVVQQNIDQTIAMYNESPDIWETWIAIGNLRSLLKDYEGAISAYRQSIVLQSNNVLGYRNMAEIYRVNLQDYIKAEEYYKLAIENNFSDYELYISLALLQHNKLNNIEKAESTYLEGLMKTSNNSDIMIRLIRFYKTTGQQEKFEQRAKQLLELYPDNEAYWKEWGGIINK